MTLREYWLHLLYWFRTFPRWHTTEHTFIGPVTTGVCHCLVCGREEVTAYEEEEETEDEYDDNAYLTRVFKRDSED